MMKKVIPIALVAACSIAAFLVIRGRTLHAQHPALKPFTAYMVLSLIPPNQAKPSEETHYTTSLFSDGSSAKVWIRQAPDGAWKARTDVVNVSAKTMFTVDPYTNSITTVPMNERAGNSHGVVQAGECLANPSLPHSQLLGYDVVEIDTHLPATPPPEGISVAKWEAPSLDCFPLREVYRITRQDSSVWQNVHEALLVIEGEPPASLLAPPASGYVERSPSERAAEFERRYPGHHAYSDAAANLGDQKYNRARQDSR